MEINLQIDKAKQGDQAAFTFLLNLYWNEVYGFMLKRTENESLAEDITIESFAKAFDKIARYKPEFQFNTWLITIAKNIYIDWLRKRKDSPFIDSSEAQDQQAKEIPDLSPTIEDEIIRQQNLAQLLVCIKQLSPQYQEVIHLRYFQEMSYQEIADHSQQPLSNVKIKLLRAKKLLLEIIQSGR